eukprot:8020298-Pyramimonas_sp.AAC.1
MLAGHAHWGVKGGIIVVVVCLRHAAGMDDDNPDAVHELRSYLRVLNARKLDWVAMGDWNMEVGELRGPWLEEVRGIPIVPPGPTCWQAEEGSCLDYVSAAPNLDIKLGGVRVSTEAALYRARIT